ncbi:hypothetical protein ACEPAF_7951 [Sanghuangporus sanghuang]
MPPSHSKKLTEKAKAAQDAEALKNEPKLCSSDDTIDLDDDDNSDDDYQPDGDVSVNDVVQVANETGLDETTWYREEPDFSILEHEQGNNVEANNDSISFRMAIARGLLDPVTSTPARRKDPVTSTPAVRKSKCDTIIVKVLVSNGVGRWELLLSIEGPWYRKEGPNKYLLKYLDTQAALNKIFDEVCKHQKEQNKKKTNAPDPKIIDTNAMKKKGKQAMVTKSVPAQLNNTQDTYKESMAKIFVAKLEASFKCDEHGHLCVRLPGACNHITYTYWDIEEHARLLYQNAPGVTYNAPPEAFKLLNQKPLDLYSARAANERILKSSSAPAFSPSEAEQPLTQPATLGIQTTPAEPSAVAAQHPSNMQFLGFIHLAII